MRGLRDSRADRLASMRPRRTSAYIARSLSNVGIVLAMLVWCMARDVRQRWEATTLGRDKRAVPEPSLHLGVNERSGSVRAIALDPDRYSITDRLGEGGMGEVRR